MSDLYHRSLCWQCSVLSWLSSSVSCLRNPSFGLTSLCLLTCNVITDHSDDDSNMSAYLVQRLRQGHVMPGEQVGQHTGRAPGHPEVTVDQHLAPGVQGGVQELYHLGMSLSSLIIIMSSSPWGSVCWCWSGWHPPASAPCTQYLQFTTFVELRSRSRSSEGQVKVRWGSGRSELGLSQDNLKTLTKT